MIPKIYSIDERRQIVIPGDQEETAHFATNHWIDTAQQALREKGSFYVALSGGSTPKQIFKILSSQRYRDRINWTRVYLFWSDERAVPPDHPDSNYHMAMIDGGLGKMPISTKQIFRMHGEEDLEATAPVYEQAIRQIVPDISFDLIMLGMGDDGHTASLFPHTKALVETKKLVVANYVPQKNCWRLSFTFNLINQAKNIVFYVMGAEKAQVLEKVLTSPANPEELPAQNVGKKENPALWIVDKAAAQNILTRIS